VQRFLRDHLFLCAFLDISLWSSRTPKTMSLVLGIMSRKQMPKSVPLPLTACVFLVRVFVPSQPLSHMGNSQTYRPRLYERPRPAWGGGQGHPYGFSN